MVKEFFVVDPWSDRLNISTKYINIVKQLMLGDWRLTIKYIIEKDIFFDFFQIIS